jgi:hypothetical protein
MPRKKVGITTRNDFKTSTTKKIAEHKPFEIGGFKFFPCNFASSKKQRLYYFLLCRDANGIPKCELLSPKFANKEQAEEFVYKRKDFSIRAV